jgi:hypothetical protein
MDIKTIYQRAINDLLDVIDEGHTDPDVISEEVNRKFEEFLSELELFNDK